jgi:hypothetical protein
MALAQQNSYSFSLDSVDSHLIMTLQTLSPVPCLGTSIRNQVQWGGDTIVVVASGFIRPTPCIDGVEPASARISLGRQIKTAFYLRFREEASDDVWGVTRTEGGFQLTPVHRSFTTYLKK